jgi:hypothetical protein
MCSTSWRLCGTSVNSLVFFSLFITTCFGLIGHHQVYKLLWLRNMLQSSNIIFKVGGLCAVTARKIKGPVFFHKTINSYFIWHWFSHLSSTNWRTRKPRTGILCNNSVTHAAKIFGCSKWIRWMSRKSRFVASVITRLKSFGCYLCVTLLENFMWTIRTLWNKFNKIFHFLSAASMCVYNRASTTAAEKRAVNIGFRPVSMWQENLSAGGICITMNCKLWLWRRLQRCI